MRRLSTTALVLVFGMATPAWSAPPVTTVFDHNRVFNPTLSIDNDFGTYAHRVGDVPNRCPFPASGDFTLVSGRCRYNNPGGPGNGQTFLAWTAYTLVYDDDVATCGIDVILDYSLTDGMGGNASTVLFYSIDGGVSWTRGSLTWTGYPGMPGYFTGFGGIPAGTSGTVQVILGRTQVASGVNTRQLRWHGLFLEPWACG